MKLFTVFFVSTFGDINMNKCERTEQQNERMRSWFKSRTGLKTDMLSSHMKKIDKMLGEQNPSADEYDMIAIFDWYEVAPANLINELKTSFWGADDIEDPMVHIGFYEYWFHLQNEKEENKFNEIMNRYRINKNYKSHTIMDN